jgi:DNA-binding transcriptional MerR regulator
MEEKEPVAPASPPSPVRANGAATAERRDHAPAGGRYAMSDLEEQTGFSARTIRYYITQGLLPPAHGRGPSATYDRTHLLRLMAIRALKDRHLPLDEIKTELGNLRDEEIALQLGQPDAPPEDRWRRISIHPDIELHVRERPGPGVDAAFLRAVELIAKQARVIVDDLDRAP